MPLDWSPLWLSLRYAGLATLLAVLAALPLGWLLGRRFSGRELLAAAASLPAILPPAVLAYYLLSALGRWPLRFSWHAAVPLSAFYTLPLVLRMTWPAAVDHRFENAARGLGANEWRILWRVTLPLAWRALFAAILAGFGRAFLDFFLTALLATHAGFSAAWLILAAGAVAVAALALGRLAGRERVNA
jgi:molybdate transport system permease protein